jgi:hypothetical protein
MLFIGIFTNSQIARKADEQAIRESRRQNGDHYTQVVRRTIVYNRKPAVKVWLLTVKEYTDMVHLL